MFIKKVLILFLTVAAMVAAYFINELLKNKINPRKSLLHFIMFMLANLIVIFGLIFILSFILFKYKGFFFNA